MKVIDLMQIPSADGLFQKGLVMSGVMEGDPLGAGEKRRNRDCHGNDERAWL